MSSRVFRFVQTLAKITPLALAALALSSSRALALPGSVIGLVVDNASQPVAGATVGVAGHSALSDATGHYLVTSVPTGHQIAKASKSGYIGSSAPVTVTSATTATAATLTLDARWATIRGAVTDAVTALPLVGATVTLAGQQTTTNVSGTYRFDKVPAGSQTLAVSALVYKSASRTITVPEDHSVLSVDVALTAVGPGNTIRWNGSNNYLYGANYAWYNYGTDFGTGGWGKTTDWNAIAAGLATLKGTGARVVRWWVFADGRYAPDFNADGTVAGLDTSVLPDIDRMLQIAASNNIYLLLTVMDGSMWSKATYSGAVTMGGHEALVTNATAQQTFLDRALKPLVQHVAASPYRKYVLGYDIVNEPEANMATYWGGVNLPPAQVMAFAKRCAAYIHLYGAGAYATVGSATPYYVVYWKGLGLDFYQAHYYPWMDFGHGAGSGLPTYASLGLDRPCLIGEFPNADASYGATDTAPLSAKWYLDAIYAKGYAGALTWSFCVPDSATKWNAFQPLFTSWAQSHTTAIGPK
jgi:hypothetical protein